MTTSLEKFAAYHRRAPDWREAYDGPLVLSPAPREPCRVSLDAWQRIFTRRQRTAGDMVPIPRLEWRSYQ